ncbi:MAG TPA: hypothetical protein VFO58_16850 [Vicinamibacterales bacterium]|nr:hypothetical protein [Vicinamibacterales bacterium]
MLWTAALVLCFGVGLVVAQDKPKVQTAVGPVAKVGGTMLVVDTGGGKSLQFITSATTTITLPRGERQEAEAKREGKEGLKVTEVVHQGDQVSVKYTDVSGKLMAQSIDVLQRRPAGALPQK